MTWVLPATVKENVGARVEWDLINADGVVYNTGQGEAVSVTPHPVTPGVFKYQVYAMLSIPGNIPVNASGTSYQIRWRLLLAGRKEPIFAFDTFRVKPIEFYSLGAVDSVELYSDVAPVQLLLPSPAFSLALEIYRDNDKLFDEVLEGDPKETTEGFLYEFPLDLPTLRGNQPSLTPLNLVWKYREAEDAVMRSEMSRLWTISPSILAASQEIESFLNRMLLDSGVTPGTMLTPTLLMHHLQKGRDAFNSYIRPTNFTMTNATAGIKQYWLMYAIVDACRTMYLLEGNKQFEFQGSSVSLSVDRSQYWSQIAQDIQGQNEQQVKLFKDNLAKWGWTGGDGNVTGPRPGAVGQVGVALSPLTPLRGTYFRPGVSFPWF